ncbi:MAG: response regulator transcription factor [Actinomycetota bacterium]|nr:response regulator transcription factor [Actinomycetota bacterium]
MVAGTVRVLLVDDRPEIRTLVRRIVRKEDWLEIVGEAENGHDAVQKVAELAPDVVIMDVEMPVLGGIEATRIIKERWPDVRVVAFTGVHDQEILTDLTDAGASAHLLKTNASGLLAPLIAAVARSERPLVVVLDEDEDRDREEGSVPSRERG